MTPATEERRATAVPGAPRRYVGWLQRGRSNGGSFDSFRTESVAHFDFGWAELWRIHWTRTVDTTWRTDENCYFLSLMLDGPLEEVRRNVALAQAEPYGGCRVRLVPPGQTIHSVSSPGGEARALRCFIDAGFVEALLPEKPSAEECAQLGAFDLRGSTIEWMLLRMHREFCAADVGMVAAVDGIARGIAVEIARHIERRRQADRPHSGGLPSWRMRLLLDRIYAEGPLPSLDELARMCGMTVRHLGRAFQVETGKTLGKFITAAMAERAGVMLEAGLPVGSVAATLGYASSSSFAHAFQRETGLLPSTVREGRGKPQ